jgi:hypothetical protein
MGIEAGTPDAAEQRAAFEDHIRAEITDAGGEGFKLLTDL